MIKNIAIGVAIVLVIFLLFRNCGKSNQIAHLEGELDVKEQILADAAAKWEAARKVWAAAETVYKEEKVKLEGEIATHMGNIDSLSYQVTVLETAYTQLEQSGAPCGQLLANMTLQRDSWRQKSGEWEDSYKQEHAIRLHLEVSYAALLTEQEASDQRYTALESVCSTLRTELKIAKRANSLLGLQGKALKVVVGAALVAGGLRLAKVI